MDQSDLPGMWEPADLFGGEADSTVYCPFAEDGICPGGCPSMTERACINGLDDE